MTTERINALKPLLEDEKFANEIMDMSSSEEVMAAFARHGVPVSESEIIEIGEAFNKAVGDNEELSEQDLSNVAGGFAISTVLIIGGAIVLCYVAGRVLGKIA